jgi:hypothetical protein
VRVLIEDTFATSTYTVPLTFGWVTPPAGLEVELIHGLSGEQIGESEMALAPSAAIAQLQRSHQVEPVVAVVAAGVGAVAMRTPVRPDEIDATPVRLLDAADAELLARATLRPFYGIKATAWLENDSPGASHAQVVVVAGAEALREPEAGYGEDLTRAWFILTALPVVSHVLLLPRQLSADERQSIVAFFEAARDAGLSRRREWRTALADREGIPRDRAGAFWAAQRLTLDEADRQALRELLTRGTRDGFAPRTTSVPFTDGADTM